MGVVDKADKLLDEAGRKSTASGFRAVEIQRAKENPKKAKKLLKGKKPGTEVEIKGPGGGTFRLHPKTGKMQKHGFYGTTWKNI